MDDHIHFALPRGFERPIEILEEVVASSAADDARAGRQVEADVCVGDEQDAHVTPTRGRMPGARPRVEAPRLTAAPQAHLP